MICINEKKDCCGCGACEQICPKHCISMREDKEGFLYPFVEIDACVKCGLCEKVCQYLNVFERNSSPLFQYSFVHADDDVRKKTSSGGIFICLAEEILKKNGVVFGACFDDFFNVKLSYAETLVDCWNFVGSKYVQASVGDAYKNVKRFLMENRPVLFTGTPCQINGLQHYLGRNYKNLLKMDFTCHAIPSPAIWKNYLKSVKGCFSIHSVNFRDKDVAGWRNYGLTIFGKKDDNQEIKLVSEGNRQNLYMKGFIRNLYDRPSCSNCVSKGFSSSSDIMIGDFWNVEKYHHEAIFNDNKGVSIAMAVSEKGNDYLKRLTAYGRLSYISQTELEMDKSHDCIMHSMPQHPHRKTFFFFYRLGIPLKVNIWLCLDFVIALKKICIKLKKKLFREHC